MQITDEELLKNIRTNREEQLSQTLVQPPSIDIKTMRSGGQRIGTGCHSYYFSTNHTTPTMVHVKVNELVLSVDQTTRILHLINEFTAPLNFTFTFDNKGVCDNKGVWLILSLPKYENNHHMKLVHHFLRALYNPLIDFWKWFYFIEANILPKPSFSETWVMAAACAGVRPDSFLIWGYGYYEDFKQYNNSYELKLLGKINKKLDITKLYDASKVSCRIQESVHPVYVNGQNTFENNITLTKPTKLQIIEAIMKQQGYTNIRLRKRMISKLPTYNEPVD